VLGPLRPILRLLAAAHLAAGWRRLLKQQGAAKAAAAADPPAPTGGAPKSGGASQSPSPAAGAGAGAGGGCCDTRASLLAKTALALLLMFLPELLKLAGGPAIAPPVAGSRLLTLQVGGRLV
jgi:hypothetical protein